MAHKSGIWAELSHNIFPQLHKTMVQADAMLEMRIIFFLNNFISLFLSVPSLCCFLGFSVVVASGDYSLVAMLGLLIGVASLVAKHGL